MMIKRFHFLPRPRFVAILGVALLGIACCQETSASDDPAENRWVAVERPSDAADESRNGGAALERNAAASQGTEAAGKTRDRRKPPARHPAGQSLPASMLPAPMVPAPISSPVHHRGNQPINWAPPAGCQNFNSPCGLPVADRDGRTPDEEKLRSLGIGPCEPACQTWQCPHDAPFCLFGPGEYAGPPRTRRLEDYRLRPGDTVQFLFLLTELKSSGAYRLAVGDELLIESEADEELKRGSLERGLRIQPDGTLTLRLIGQVYAAGQTVDQLRQELEERYQEYYPEPAIDVTPINTGSAALKVRDAISGVGGFAPQQTTQTVTPSGEIRLPKIGRVIAQGLSIDELKQEVNLRYDAVVGGIEVEPSIQSQAPHHIFVLGEVRNAGRYELGDTPTTVTGAIAMAGSYVPGANLRQIVIFRRGEDWRLLSTLVDLRGALLGRQSHPRDEIFLRDGDIVILPSTPIRLFDNFVRQVFTEGIYGVVPLSASYNFGESF